MKRAELNTIKISAAAAVVVLVMTLWFATPLPELLQPEKIEELLAGVSGTLEVFIAFQLLYALGTCLFIPAAVITFAAALVFDFSTGMICACAGIFWASLSGYAMGRFLSAKTEFISRLMARYKGFETFQKRGFWAILLLRLAPTPPFTVTSLMAGTLKLPIPSYAVATVIGVLPLTLLIQVFGQQILLLIKEPSILAVWGILALGALIALLQYGKKRFIASKLETEVKS